MTFELPGTSTRAYGLLDPRRDESGSGGELAHAGNPHALARRAKLAVILMPYFGTWPEWIEAFFETCRWNPSIDWIFFTDCGDPRRPLPPNVALRPMSFSEFNDLYTARFPGHQRLETPYKICDIRPAFGLLFHEEVASYRFFGWGDVDVIYGDIAAYLTDEMVSADVISFNRDHLSGHLTLVTTAHAATLPVFIPDWAARVDEREYRHLDEPPAVPRLRVAAAESFNTPLSPFIPWTTGEFVFPREWYWQDGRLTNDLDGDASFPYLHFMHWKGGAWARECGNAQWERLERVMNIEPDELPNGFRINEAGFFPLRRTGAMT